MWKSTPRQGRRATSTSSLGAPTSMLHPHGRHALEVRVERLDAVLHVLERRVELNDDAV
jgi:hypothetical protein